MYLVQGPRTPYRVSVCVHLHNLISAFGDGVSGLSVPTRDVPRSSNIYLSSLPPSASSSSLSRFISSRRFITSRCVSKPNKSRTSLSYRPIFFNIPQTSKCPVPLPLLPRTSSPSLRTSLSSSSSRPEVLHTSLRSTLIAHHSKSSRKHCYPPMTRLVVRNPMQAKRCRQALPENKC